MTIANADSFELHRWYVGVSQELVFVVRWENATSLADDDGNYDNDEQKCEFVTLDEALGFGRALLLADV